MFVEVNKLEGLIINPLNLTSLEEVIDVFNNFTCVYLTDKIINTPSNIIISSPPEQMNFTYPVSSAIKEALIKMRMQPSQVAYVTAQPEEICEAINSHVGTIYVGYSDSIKATFLYPDYIVETLDCINEIIYKKHGGFFSELIAFRESLNCRPYNKGISLIPLYQNFREYGIDVIALGRYFPTKDTRSYKHPLSKWILKSKNENLGEKFIKNFSSIAIPYIDILVKKGKVDAITRIPPRPINQNNDRMANYLINMCRKYPQKLQLDILHCNKDYEKQSELSNIDRMNNIRGAFNSTVNSIFNHVLIVDDIITTGNTSLEAAKTLLSAGCKKVSILAIAMTSKLPNNIHTLVLTCPRCNGKLVMRVRNDNGIIFWGCENFDSGCRGNLNNGLQGLQRLNAMNNATNIVNDIDISF